MTTSADDDATSSGQAAPTTPGEPGSVSSPQDVGGRGPVGLQDRTGSGEQASPDTNQAKAEPEPATPGEPDPTAPVEPPLLGDMNVGGADPQLPSSPLARDRDVPVATPPVAVMEPGVAPPDDRPALDGAGTTELPEGPEQPTKVGPGTAQRAPGSQGVSPDQQETDVETGAAQMQVGGGPGATPAPVEPGDAQEVPVPHEVPAEGTSQTLPIAHGARSAEPPQD